MKGRYVERQTDEEWEGERSILVKVIFGEEVEVFK